MLKNQFKLGCLYELLEKWTCLHGINWMSGKDFLHFDVGGLYVSLCMPKSGPA